MEEIGVGISHIAELLVDELDFGAAVVDELDDTTGEEPDLELFVVELLVVELLVVELLVVELLVLKLKLRVAELVSRVEVVA